MWSGVSGESQEKNVDKGEISLASLSKFFFRSTSAFVLAGCLFTGYLDHPAVKKGSDFL